MGGSDRRRRPPSPGCRIAAGGPGSARRPATKRPVRRRADQPWVIEPRVRHGVPGARRVRVADGNELGPVVDRLGRERLGQVGNPDAMRRAGLFYPVVRKGRGCRRGGLPVGLRDVRRDADHQEASKTCRTSHAGAGSKNTHPSIICLSTLGVFWRRQRRHGSVIQRWRIRRRRLTSRQRVVRGCGAG